MIIKLIGKYIELESKLYKPKCKFKKGDKISYNWKAKIYFKTLGKNEMVFNKIENGVVYTDCRNSINLYWLKSANNKNK